MKLLEKIKTISYGALGVIVGWGIAMWITGELWEMGCYWVYS